MHIGSYTKDVAIIIPSLTQHGGAERVAMRTASYLLKIGYRITFYVHEYKNSLLLENSCGDANIRLLSGFASPHERFNVAPIRWEAEIGDHDLYITHLFPTHQINVAPMIAYVHEPFRLVGDLAHEIPIWEPSTEFIINDYKTDTHLNILKKKILPSESLEYKTIDQIKNFNPSVILTNSYSTKSLLKNLYPNKDVTVLYPGVDFIQKGRADYSDYWPNSNFTDRKFKILHVGAVAYLKRWRVLVDALAHCPDLECTFIGQGPEIPFLRDAIRQYDLEGRVFVVGQISDEDMNVYWREYDALVMCSLREPFGMIALEAASRGLPVIIDQDSGVREVLEGACLLSDSTPLDLIEKINVLKNDKELYCNLAVNARNIAKHYTWDNFGKKINQLINQVSTPNKFSNELHDPVLIGYCVDYGMSDAYRFGKNTPVLGKYSSHEGWVIRKHLSYFVCKGLKNIALKVRLLSPQKIGEQLRVIQRVKEIVEEEFYGIRFALWIDLTDSCEISSLHAIINFWRALNFKNKLEIGGNLILVLTGSKSNRLGIFKKYTDLHILSNLDTDFEFINSLRYQSCEFSGELEVLKWVGGVSELTLFDSFNDYPSNKFFEQTIESKNRPNHFIGWGIDAPPDSRLKEFVSKSPNIAFAKIPLSDNDRIHFKNSLFFLRTVGGFNRKIWLDIDDINIFTSDFVTLQFWERSENMNHVLIHVEANGKIIFTNYHLSGAGWARFDLQINQIISEFCSGSSKIIIEVKAIESNQGFEYDFCEPVLSIGKLSPNSGIK